MVGKWWDWQSMNTITETCNCYFSKDSKIRITFLLCKIVSHWSVICVSSGFFSVYSYAQKIFRKNVWEEQHILFSLPSCIALVHTGTTIVKCHLSVHFLSGVYFKQIITLLWEKIDFEFCALHQCTFKTDIILDCVNYRLCQFVFFSLCNCLLTFYWKLLHSPK